MRESGSASVLAVAAMTILLIMVPAVIDMGAVVMARAKAHNAADAAALAAAQELVSGGNPSAAAAKYAGLNGADVAGLVLEQESVTITASVDCRLTFVDKFGIKIGPVRGQGKAELKNVAGLDY
ncbi:MAG: Rv3654c family TadE-like protein [Actinomycetota bacterium]